VFILTKVLAGVETVIETVNTVKDTNYIVSIEVGATDVITIYGESDDALTTFAFTPVAMPGALDSSSPDKTFSFATWYRNSTKRFACLRYFEILNDYDSSGLSWVKCQLSRDNGATWSAEIMLQTDQGIVHRVAPVLTGTPDDQLRARFYVKHPARLYGWGVSW
jgi:hypothetical protein